MSDGTTKTMTRRELLETMGKVATMSVVAGPFIGALGDGFAVSAQALPLAAIAGVDRVVMNHGKTYLSAWAGYGAPPRPGRQGGGGRGQAAPTPPAEPPGPAPTTTWSKLSGPGTVSFADPKAAATTAAFSAPGDYMLQVIADNGTTKASSTLAVKVELPPPAAQLMPVVTTRHTITSPMWASRTKALITSWIPHCIDQINRTDIPAGRGDGGIDNFVEAAKAHRGEPYAAHKGYVFSNAWVHQTVEAMSLALMVDPQGDQEIIAAQAKMQATLDDWIPKILAAQHPDGYLQTAFTLRNAPKATPRPGTGGTAVPANPNAAQRPVWTAPWQPAFRGNHEGYTGGYFIESAINHYTMTGHKDARLYDAAKKLGGCWADHIGPAPKQEWFDGHQEMEQALVRFGRFVNEVEPGRKGDRYIALAKFLLDNRKGGTEYDQSHVPVQQQYEAVGHAVRAVYTYSGMADVAVETHDVDYQSAVKSLWDNIVHKKYYLTGGVGSGESSEGFGPNYSLRNNAYCENCSSCGEIFFQWKMHLAYHDAQYADLYEQTIYNALFGGMDLGGKNFYYDNPLDASRARYPWHTCPCCVGNMSRTLLMLPTWMYSKDATGIYVNLFAGNTMTIDHVVGTSVELVQATEYPWKGNVAITVNPAAAKSFAMRLRVPNRDVSRLYATKPAANGITSIKVNGAKVTPTIANGYASITRTWKKGDRIELELPMVAQRVYASDKIVTLVSNPADRTAPPTPTYPTRNKVAIKYGPLVYNIEAADQDITNVLPPNAPLTPEWRGDLFGGVMTITSTFANGAPMLAIPNYARMNRVPPGPDVSVPLAQQPPAPAPAQPGAPRPTPPPPPPPQSIVWIKER
jgi:DUF1680 family protein